MDFFILYLVGLFLVVLGYVLLLRSHWRVLGAIRKHRDQHADDRCWMDDAKLYAVLPEALQTSKIFRVGDKEAMLKNCQRYVERRCWEGGGWKSYAELEQENQRLREHYRKDIAYLREQVNSLKQEDLANITAESNRRSELADQLSRKIGQQLTHGLTGPTGETLREWFDICEAICNRKFVCPSCRKIVDWGPGGLHACTSGPTEVYWPR